MSVSIGHQKYTELLSRIINNVATDKERQQVADFEAAQPEHCPQCGDRVRSQFQPVRVVHDVVNCPRKNKAEPKRARFEED
jgi:hypothetical protein